MRKGIKCGSKLGKYLLSRRPAGAPVINIQSTLRTAPDLLKKKNFIRGTIWYQQQFVYNLYAVRYVYILFIYSYILQNVETLLGEKINKILGKQ